MTALLTEEYREPPDCPYAWGDGYTRCTWHDLPVHRCLIQGGHDGSCLCMCLSTPPPVLPREQVFTWVGYIDECAFMWPTADGLPCIDANPTQQHMCTDGDPRTDYDHSRNYHTCHCGERTHTPHGYRRAQRDLERS